MARLCKHGCGRPAAKRRTECSTCRDKSPARVKKQARNKHRRSSVGFLLTPAEWQALYHKQAGVCAVCSHPLRNRYAPTHAENERVASVDHDHVVEHRLRKKGQSPEDAIRASIRGLLCGYPCNRLLVRYWTRHRLASAAAYLQAWPSVEAGLVPYTYLDGQ